MLAILMITRIQHKKKIRLIDIESQTTIDRQCGQKLTRLKVFSSSVIYECVCVLERKETRIYFLISYLLLQRQQFN